MVKWKSAVGATFAIIPFLLASCTQSTQLSTGGTPTVRTEKEYEDLKNLNDKVQADLIATQTRVRDLQAKYDKMDADLGEAQIQNSNLRMEADKVKKDLSATELQIKTLQGQYDKVKADLETAETQNKSLQAEYERTMADLAQALDKIKRTVITNVNTGTGARIEQGNVAVTLHSFSEYKETESSYIKRLRSGYVYYVADLTVENNSRDKKFSYGRIFTKLQTAEGYVYEYTNTSVMSGIATLGDLPPGEKSRFMISFAIPQTAKPAQLTYTASGMGTAVFAFELGDTGAPPPIATTTMAPPPSLSPTSTLTETPEQFKTSAKSGLAYTDLLRNTETYVGQRVFYKGRVFQVTNEKGESVTLLVDITGNADVVWVNYTGLRVLEGDTVQFWGTIGGRRTYTNISFKEVTIPEITVKYLDIVQKR